MWYAGIDWADRHHDAIVVVEAGRRVATLRVEHSAAGLAKLTASLRGIGDVADHPVCRLLRLSARLAGQR